MPAVFCGAAGGVVDSKVAGGKPEENCKAAAVTFVFLAEAAETLAVGSNVA